MALCHSAGIRVKGWFCRLSDVGSQLVELAEVTGIEEIYTRTQTTFGFDPFRIDDQGNVVGEFTRGGIIRS